MTRRKPTGERKETLRQKAHRIFLRRVERDECGRYETDDWCNGCRHGFLSGYAVGHREALRNVQKESGHE